jgi:pilus assembly protein CpaB
MMRKGQLIVLVVAIAMGGGAAYLARSWLSAHTGASSANQQAGHIVVAAESLAYGAAVNSDSVTEIPWFSNTLPEGAFATKDDLLEGGRRIVLSPLKRGEPILRSKITGPGQRASLATLLDEGKRAVTVRVDDVRGVAGFVLPGDFVDIVMIADDASNRRQSYSDILLEHVKVLAIDQVAGEAEGKPAIARAVTVEVTKEQAQKILLATNIGKLSLLLGRPIETSADPNRRISERDIGRIVHEPVRPSPPAPVAPAPPAPSNLVKVSIVRNGETKEYTVMKSDESGTDGRRASRAGLPRD